MNLPCPALKMKRNIRKKNWESMYLDKKGGDVADDEILRGTLGSDQ